MLTQWINLFLAALHRLLTGKPLPESNQRDGELLLCLLVITCLAFGFEITNPTLGVDDYGHLGIGFEWQPFWVSRGMWGALGLQFLLPGGWITPFIALVLSISLQCVSALVICWLLKLRDLGYGQRFVVCALFTTFPYFATQMAFSYLQIGYTVSTFLCVAALLMATTTSLWRLLSGVVLIGFAISIYQGAISVVVTGVVLTSLFTWLPNHCATSKTEPIKSFVRWLLVVTLGGALYIIMHKAILYYTGLPAGEGYYAVTMDLAFWNRWPLISNEIAYLFLGADGLIPHSTQWIFLLMMVFVITRLWWQHPAPRLYRAIAIAGYLVCLLLAPFTVMFLHEGGLAPRSTLGIGMLWLATWAAALKISGTTTNKFHVTIGLCVIFVFIFQNNRMFYAQYLVEKADSIAAARMMERITQLDAENQTQPIQGVVVLGSYSHHKLASTQRYCGSVLGYSQFEWDMEKMHIKMRNLTRSLGISQYRWVDADVLGTTADAQQLVANRQPWPHPDSVFLQGDYAVLWLGERKTHCGEGNLLLWLLK